MGALRESERGIEQNSFVALLLSMSNIQLIDSSKLIHPVRINLQYLFIFEKCLFLFMLTLIRLSRVSISDKKME